MKYLLLLALGGGAWWATQPHPTTASAPTQTAPALKENFEGDKKGRYEAETVALSSGAWTLDDALLGSTDEDRKAGERAVRLRDAGSLTMAFDLPGVGTVSIRHARYGEDPPATWQLWYSANGGKKWISAGKPVTTATTRLQTATVALNVAGKVRLAFRKTNGEGRLNLDDLTVTSFGSPATTTPPSVASRPVAPVSPADRPAGTVTDRPARNPTAPPAPSDNLFLALGNPSNATPDENTPDNYLLIKPQFALSYNRSRGIPNWVSWYVDDSWLGTAERQNDFRPDPSLPAGWYRVTPGDYVGGGFDRGHVCPSADRQNTLDNNSATFLMTNMVPQSPDNNQGPWEKLEAYLRRIAAKDQELYIIAGAYGEGGTGRNGLATRLRGKVTVPAHTWKVVVVLPKGDNDLARITADTRVIAIDIPNVQGIKPDYWTTYATSVDAIEKATGLDLLANLPATLQATLEAKVGR